MKKNGMDIFKEHNKDVLVENKEKKIIVSKIWRENSFHFEFNNKTAMSFMKSMDFPKDLFAIYHRDKRMYEFIYLPLPEDYSRSFEYIYQGKSFKLYYGSPTSSFEKLVKHFVLDNSVEYNERVYGMLSYFNFYNNRDSSLIPINFFVEGDFESMQYNDHVSFFKQVNFMMKYYDRKSPYILIFDTNEEGINEIKIPCKNDSIPFPTILNSKKYDSTLLDLMEAAQHSSSIRLKYIFYYQVLEYCSYYYLENGLKRKLENIVKSPDILNANLYSSKIIELYSDYFKRYNSEAQRMDSLLKELCSFDNIKNEIATNADCFLEDICFDGGVKIEKLFNKKEDIDNPQNGIMLLIRKNIDTIRNVLVHARESRENVVIAPTAKNNILLRPYLYVLRRLAEEVIIKFE